MITKLKTEMVVGWFEVELWVVWGSYGTMLVRKALGLWINCNCVDCEALCGSLWWIDYEVLECDTCGSPSLPCPQVTLCA